jgi:hypothetical protein
VGVVGGPARGCDDASEVDSGGGDGVGFPVVVTNGLHVRGRRGGGRRQLAASREVDFIEGASPRSSARWGRGRQRGGGARGTGASALASGVVVAGSR